MPRIKVQAPSKVQPSEGRAFALLKQLEAAPGEVDAEQFKQFLERYGAEGAAGKAIDSGLSFEEFSALFARPATAAEKGEGDAVGYAAWDNSGHVSPWRFSRRAPGPKDVRIQIAYTGICHSDLHMAKNEWGMAVYPCVPGHEIVGFVTEVGSEVTQFKVGDRVGVGCLVNSCQDCPSCLKDKEEQYCEKGFTLTYGSPDKDGTITYGGYSSSVVVDEKFVLRVPASLPLYASAPLLCAGITVYSPIRHFKLDKPGLHVGVLGLGGLGHMAVKFLKALGVQVTVISTSPGKKEEALKVLGADHFLVSKDPEQMKSGAATLHGIINTVSAPLDLNPYLALLKRDGTLVCVGAPAEPSSLPQFAILFRRLRVVGSAIGSIKETQEMLDLCGEKGITCMSELITADKINEAYVRLEKGDVRYRFVIDVQGSIIA